MSKVNNILYVTATEMNYYDGENMHTQLTPELQAMGSDLRHVKRLTVCNKAPINMGGVTIIDPNALERVVTAWDNEPLFKAEAGQGTLGRIVTIEGNLTVIDEECKNMSFVMLGEPTAEEIADKIEELDCEGDIKGIAGVPAKTMTTFLEAIGVTVEKPATTTEDNEKAVATEKATEEK